MMRRFHYDGNWSAAAELDELSSRMVIGRRSKSIASWGPGLPEEAYQGGIGNELTFAEIPFEAQKSVDIV